jgi:hypothetical protein
LSAVLVCYLIIAATIESLLRVGVSHKVVVFSRLIVGGVGVLFDYRSDN